jgi:hypothetical protein
MAPDVLMVFLVAGGIETLGPATRFLDFTMADLRPNAPASHSLLATILLTLLLIGASVGSRVSRRVTTAVMLALWSHVVADTLLGYGAVTLAGDRWRIGVAWAPWISRPALAWWAELLVICSCVWLYVRAASTADRRLRPGLVGIHGRLFVLVVFFVAAHGQVYLVLFRPLARFLQ